MSSAGGDDSWAPVPIAEVPADQLSWHYTGVEGLLGIISSHSLWASSPRVLNDTSELQYGAEVLAEAWANIRERNRLSESQVLFTENVIGEEFLTALMDDAFILSTSLEGDLLPQWMHYSKSDGFAIGLDLSVPLWPKTTAGKEKRRGAVRSGWATVTYDRVQQIKLCAAHLDSMVGITSNPNAGWADRKDRWPEIASTWRFLLGFLLLQMKHPAFSGEREVRFICGRDCDSVPKFRASHGRLIPYTEIARDPHPDKEKLMRPLTPGGFEEPKTLPIKEVRCGPDVRLGTPSLVKSMLSSYGYHDVDVSKSEIPYSGVKSL